MAVSGNIKAFCCTTMSWKIFSITVRAVRMIQFDSVLWFEWIFSVTISYDKLHSNLLDDWRVSCNSSAVACEFIFLLIIHIQREMLVVAISGKLKSVAGSVASASRHLDWAFDNCHSETFVCAIVDAWLRLLCDYPRFGVRFLKSLLVAPDSLAPQAHAKRVKRKVRSAVDYQLAVSLSRIWIHATHAWRHQHTSAVLTKSCSRAYKLVYLQAPSCWNESHNLVSLVRIIFDFRIKSWSKLSSTTLVYLVFQVVNSPHSELLIRWLDLYSSAILEVDELITIRGFVMTLR